jgi:hypothetical protein
MKMSRSPLFIEAMGSNNNPNAHNAPNSKTNSNFLLSAG